LEVSAASASKAVIGTRFHQPLAYPRLGDLADACIEQHESERRGRKKSREEGEVHLGQRNGKNKFNDDSSRF